MKMTVTVGGEPQQREVDYIQKSSHAHLPDILMPKLRNGEMVVHTIAGEVVVINLLAAARTTRYESAKPWDRLA